MLYVASILVTIICLTWYIRRVRRILNRHGGPLTYHSDVVLRGKTAIITGANSGIGKETALDLAWRGSRVILACRNLKRAREAVEEIKSATGNSNVIAMELDLNDLESVKRFGREIIQNEDRLDILINNAGIGVRLSDCTKQNFDQFFGVNYLGHFLLTYLLLDLLKKSAPSRIVNITSFSNRFVKRSPSFDQGPPDANKKYPKLSGYATSKLCNILHSKALAKKLRDTRVTSNSLHPGMVKTEILKHDPVKGRELIKVMILRFLFKYMGRSAEDGAKAVVYVATDKSLDYISGQYFENNNLANEEVNKLANDEILADNLWDASLEMCNGYL